MNDEYLVDHNLATHTLSRSAAQINSTVKSDHNYFIICHRISEHVDLAIRSYPLQSPRYHPTLVDILF